MCRCPLDGVVGGDQRWGGAYRQKLLLPTRTPNFHLEGVKCQGQQPCVHSLEKLETSLLHPIPGRGPGSENFHMTLSIITPGGTE